MVRISNNSIESVNKALLRAKIISSTTMKEVDN